MSVFLLAEGAAPFRVLAQSPPWCFPSPTDASRCESIQFVVSMIFSEDGSELLLGYGVNDCDARVQRVPLALALELAQRGSVLEGRPAHGTLRERRSALELENCTRLGR